jgi:hypothetical protein
MEISQPVAEVNAKKSASASAAAWRGFTSVLAPLESVIVGRDTLSRRQTGIGFGWRAFTLNLVAQEFEPPFAKLFAGIRSYA